VLHVYKYIPLTGQSNDDVNFSFIRFYTQRELATVDLSSK